MPLAYEVREELTIPEDLFNADSLAVLLAHGSRYGGQWLVNALGPDQAVLGTIFTEQDERPDMAVDTAYIWINDVCVRNGLKIVASENLNDQFPADQAPFFALSRFVVAHKDWE